MIKIIVWTDISKTEMTTATNEEAIKIKQKVISKMNNGNVVVLGETVINPAHIRFIEFKGLKNKEVEEANNVDD